VRPGVFRRRIKPLFIQEGVVDPRGDEATAFIMSVRDPIRKLVAPMIARRTGFLENLGYKMFGHGKETGGRD
jgi:hypothetical protein